MSLVEEFDRIIDFIMAEETIPVVLTSLFREKLVNFEQKVTDRDDLRKRLAESEEHADRVEKRFELANNIIHRLPMCQDHRDKFSSPQCLACDIEELALTLQWMQDLYLIYGKVNPEVLLKAKKLEQKHLKGRRYR